MAYREELTPEEEDKLAKRGGCIALLLLPIFCYCGCTIFNAFTPIGRIANAHVVLVYVYHGLPISTYTAGFPDIARAGCALDRQNPRPPDYRERQETLKANYEAFVTLYKTHWQKLKADGGDTSPHEPADKVPSDFAGGKRYYCRR